MFGCRRAKSALRAAGGKDRTGSAQIRRLCSEPERWIGDVDQFNKNFIVFFHMISTYPETTCFQHISIWFLMSSREVRLTYQWFIAVGDDSNWEDGNFQQQQRQATTKQGCYPTPKRCGGKSTFGIYWRRGTPMVKGVATLSKLVFRLAAVCMLIYIISYYIIGCIELW